MKPGVNPWQSLAALAAGYFLVLLDQGMMPVVTPLLPFEVADSVWLTSIYLLCTVAPMPATGRLGDIYGQRRMFVVGLGLYSAALLLAGLSGTHAAFTAARAAQGLGAACFLPQAFALIPRVFPQRLMGRAFATWGVIGSVASLIGPVLGGYLAQTWGFRSVFFLQALIGAAATVAALVWVPRLPLGGGAVSAPAVALSFGGLGLLVYGIQFSSLASAAGGIVALAALAVLAARGADKGFLPLKLLRGRNFSLGVTGVAAMGFAVASMFIPMMYWLQTVANVSPTASGLITAPMSVFALAVTPVAGYLTDKRNPKLLCIAGFVTQAAGLVLAAGLAHAAAPAGWFALATALLGLGSSFVWAPNAALTMAEVDPQEAGAASGMYNTARQVGSVLGVALVGGVLGAGEVSATAAPAQLIPAAAVALGAVAASLMRPAGNSAKR